MTAFVTLSLGPFSNVVASEAFDYFCFELSFHACDSNKRLVPEWFWGDSVAPRTLQSWGLETSGAKISRKGGSLAVEMS